MVNPMDSRKMYYDEWSELPHEVRCASVRHGSETWLQDENGSYIVVPVIE